MAYHRTNWRDGETALSAENMNNIEDGIEELQSQKVDKVEGKGLSANDYTTAEKTKLAGIAAGAQVNPGVATTSAAGLMSATDKTKLNGIAAGAQVNQNAFSNVKVGSTTIAADSVTDTLTLTAGANVALTPNATNDTVTISATNTTYSAATTSTNGLMSSSDKTKLNGIASGAQKVSVIGFNLEAGTGGTHIISAGGTDEITLNVASSGLVPIGIVGFSLWGSNNSQLTMYRCYVSGNTAYIDLRNRASANAEVQGRIYVLYVTA